MRHRGKSPAETRRITEKVFENETEGKHTWQLNDTTTWLLVSLYRYLGDLAPRLLVPARGATCCPLSPHLFVTLFLACCMAKSLLELMLLLCEASVARGCMCSDVVMLGVLLPYYWSAVIGPSDLVCPCVRFLRTRRHSFQSITSHCGTCKTMQLFLLKRFSDGAPCLHTSFWWRSTRHKIILRRATCC